MVTQSEFKSLKEDVKGIRTNDLPHIYSSMKAMAVNVASINTNTDWLKKGFFGIIGVLGMILVTLILSVLK